MSFKDLRLFRERAPDTDVFWFRPGTRHRFPVVETLMWSRLPKESVMPLRPGESLLILTQAQEAVRVVAKAHTHVSGPVHWARDPFKPSVEEVEAEADIGSESFQRRADVLHLLFWASFWAMAFALVWFWSLWVPNHVLSSLPRPLEGWVFAKWVLAQGGMAFGLVFSTWLLLKIRSVLAERLRRRFPHFSTAFRPVAHLATKHWSVTGANKGFGLHRRKEVLTVEGDVQISRTIKPPTTVGAQDLTGRWEAPEEGVWTIWTDRHPAALHVHLRQGQVVHGLGWALLTDRALPDEDEDADAGFWATGHGLWIAGAVWSAMVLGGWNLFWGSETVLTWIVSVAVLVSITAALFFKAMERTVSLRWSALEGHPGVDLLPFVTHPVIGPKGSFVGKESVPLRKDMQI